MNQTLENLVEAVALLKRLQRGSNCWCEMAIGNPMYPRHSEVCTDVQRFFNVDTETPPTMLPKITE